MHDRTDRGGKSSGDRDTRARLKGKTAKTAKTAKAAKRTFDEAASDPASVVASLLATRARTDAITATILPEDATVQTMPDVSPTKWHLAHTTWFLETFVLPNVQTNFRPHHPGYAYLFNSYYENAGDRHPRPERGHASRPTLDEVRAYRAHVDHALHLLDASKLSAEMRDALILARHHEEQHQELILTDIRHVLGTQPLKPAYEGDVPRGEKPRAQRWIELGVEDGVRELGWTNAHPGFAFDNEAPRHKVHLGPFALSSRLVTEGEYRDFVDDGGYRTAGLWLSDGWAAIKSRGWQLPLYWRRGDERDNRDKRGAIRVYDFDGERAIDPTRAVSCLSLYEADAFARWAGARLPTEAEWEVAIAEDEAAGIDDENGENGKLTKRRFDQVYDTAWQWTASAYAPYPGFRPFAGDFGEYNGKFMSSQVVLRGGATTTSPDHTRRTYRNFFPPDARWQTTGIRLARDAK